MKVEASKLFHRDEAKKEAKEAKKAERKQESLTKDELKLSNEQASNVTTNLSLFPTEPTGAARKYLDNFSQGAFDPLRTSHDRLVNLKTTHDTVDQAQPANSKPTQYWETTEDELLTTGRVSLEDFKGITSLAELKKQVSQSLVNHHAAQDALGPSPTQEQIEAYIEENYLAIVQILGGHLGYYYEGFVSLNGNVDAFSPFNERGGVCSDIHAAITAFHTAHGREAYAMMSTSNDYAHIISLFKNEGKWYIQNYGEIVETEAKTLEELYDMVMPENREIKLYSVNPDGNLKQVSTDHLTATGRAERRFRAEAGIEGFSPWFAEEGITISPKGASVYKDGVYVGINYAEKEAALGFYRQDLQGQYQSIKGVAIEGQYDTNDYGYERQHIEGKYESEKRWNTENKYGRQHFSVYSGVQGSTEAPAYWQNEERTIDERDPIGQLGISYNRNASQVQGKQALKGELGYQIQASGTVSGSLYEPTSFQTAGLMYSDANVEGKVVAGVFYQPSQQFTIRTGLASGVDLGNIDGTQVGEQLNNVLESDAYLDVRFGQGVVAGNVLGEIPLHNPTQYKVGVGLALAPLNNDKLLLGATYLQEQIVTDKVDKIRVGAEIRPTEKLAFGANLSTPIMGDNKADLTVSGYVKVVGF